MNTSDSVPARSASTLVTTLFDIIDGARWDELATVFTEDCVYNRPGYDPLVGLTRLDHFYQHERIIKSGRHEVLHAVGELGAAACWGRFTGVSRTGDPLDEQFADTYLVQGDKIVLRQTYFFRPAV